MIKQTKQFRIVMAAQIWIYAAVLMASPPVLANERESARFSETYRNDGVVMELRGTGVKSVIFLKAFVAAYYENQPSEKTALGQFPKRIEVEYFVNIPGRKLNNFTVDVMKDNISKDEFKDIAEKVDLMSRYFVDLKDGDRFSLTYIPGVGTKFAHNDRITGVIEGSDFARALFSVWLGEKPFDKNLKKEIMGQDESASDKVVSRKKG